MASSNFLLGMTRPTKRRVDLALAKILRKTGSPGISNLVKSMRGDIVVDHDLPVRNAQEHFGNRRSDRKMEDDDVPAGTEPFVFLIVVDEPGQARIVDANEDLGSVAPA